MYDLTVVGMVGAIHSMPLLVSTTVQAEAATTSSPSPVTLAVVPSIAHNLQCMVNSCVKINNA